ncbi:hypothetical protein AAFF_G00388720 [Aldrovandia affinis]|uniref:Uncharacterized protein n=1 Tax=Aldrovandia affinis TaxID=143900 RepID=A0AAD7R490_9TELE|nr:hypothetical protein AAFF_G00388720 [Aldrovandia affinis]
MNRRLTTALDRLHPDYMSDMHHKQEVSCEEHHGPNRSFQEDDDVYMRSYTGGHKWIPGVIVSVTGPVSYKVQTPDGQLHRRHVDQLRGRLALRADTASTEPGNHGDLPGLPEESPLESATPARPGTPDDADNAVARVDPCVCLSLPLPYDVRQESVTHHGI